MVGAMRLLSWVAAACCAAWLLSISIFEWYRDGVCYREVLASRSNVHGLDFEVFAEDCWHNLETGVFVSLHGHRRKTLLFLYDTLEAPAITSTGDREIRIGLGDIGEVYCRNEQWQGFSITYDIRSVRYPREQLPACRRSTVWTLSAAAFGYRGGP